jgi:serine/threonine-protein kinase
MTLLAKLGEGGMAKVFFAAVGRGDLARPAAVKLLRADLPDHDYKTRFMDEAKVVVRLHHNNLVDVRSAGELGEQLYIVMEAIEGRDLADIWDRCADLGKAFPVPLAVHMVREVLRGLHYAHTFPGLGLVHRDVSPSNVLIDWAGAVRLADFGLATSTLKAALTVPGVVFGKVGYMSPEQATRGQLDGRADVYACSAVLWELITGRPLRDPRTHNTDDVAVFDARPPSDYSRRVDEALDQIVLKGLAREREDRWESAEAMMRALGGWLAKKAPGAGQEALADFVGSLFGDAREREAEARERLLDAAAAATDPGTSRSATVMYGRVATDPVPAEISAANELEQAVPFDEYEHIAAGTVIAERYRVLSRLGKGGMGTVYLGEHLTVGRNVAIKVLTHQWSGHDGVVQRFRAEARAASAAGHPNIVEVFDAGDLPDGRLYLVMEFLTGRNLFEELQEVGPMPVPRACRIMRDVARAVRAAHEVGIVHRDLKPDNIMIADRDGEFIKVLDFGISASADRGEEERLTIAGQALGTPEYMSPEQALGHEATPLFDVYAIGAIFFELLIGEPPFAGSNVLEVMTRKTTTDARAVSQLRADIPDALAELIDSCLARDPAARPQSVRVLLSRIDDILRSLPREGAHLAPPARAPGNDDAHRGPGWLFPVLILLGAVGFVVMLAYMGRDSAAVNTPRGQAGGSASSSALPNSAPSLDAGKEMPPASDTGGSEASTGVQARAGQPGELDEAGETDGAPEGQAPSPEADPAAVPGSKTHDGPTPNGEAGSVEQAGEAKTAGQAGDSGEPEGTTAATGEVEAATYQSAACRRTRNQAEDSAKAAAWRDVLSRTRKRDCWARRNDRLALEVLALRELGRFEDCVKRGSSGTSPKVKGYVKFCQKRLDRE